MKTSRFLTAILVAAFFLTGCKDKKLEAPARKATAQQTAPAAQKTQPTQKPPGHPPMGARGGMAHGAGKAGLSGKILETMNAGGYTYVKLETPKGATWAAVQKTTVKVGQKVGITNPMLMKKFKSKTLNRSFDEIYFGRLSAGGGTSAGMGAGGMHTKKDIDSKVAAAHGGHKSEKVAVKKVEKAKGGLTIAEIFAKRKALASKKVIVRGQVTKFNAGIMGRNWLHLQDGSGSVSEKTFDLTVTSQTKAKIGDIVVVEGTLAVDKDFGAGYAYSVIVEKAAIKK